MFVDGQRLEGNPVLPDVAVPFDVRYAAGNDPQRDAALALMSRAPGAGRRRDELDPAEFSFLPLTLSLSRRERDSTSEAGSRQ